jgi:hypothetical protein
MLTLKVRAHTLKVREPTPGGITAYPKGMSTYLEGKTAYPKGRCSNLKGITVLPQGMAANPGGRQLNPIRSVPSRGTFTLFKFEMRFRI